MNLSNSRRRSFLKTVAGAGVFTMLNAFVPAWARTLQVVRDPNQFNQADPMVFDLAIREHEIAIAGVR